MVSDNRQKNNPPFRTDKRKKYIAFFKPYGVLSQFSQPADSLKTTLASFGFPEQVYPVGRLDWDSEGLIILSDDPRLNAQLLTTSHWRTYLAQVENLPQPDAIDSLRNGVVIEGRKTLPAQAILLSEEPLVPPRIVPIRFRRNIPTAWIQLAICEGRNRQVRKMTASVGHPTLRLLRVAIGELQLARLIIQPGDWHWLTEEELRLAFI